jgi:hypothetical protein
MAIEEGRTKNGKRENKNLNNFISH